MPDPELERLVWRCQRGQITEKALYYLLREEARRLGDDFNSRHEERAAARRWNPQLIDEFEQARSQAYRLFDRHNYEEALQRLRSAEKSLSVMALLLEAQTDISTAEAEAAQLTELTLTDDLQRLPTISSIFGLIELARKYMRDGQYRQASFVVRLSSRQCAPLLEKKAISAERQRKLVDTLMKIDSVRAGSTHLIPDAGEDEDETLEGLKRLLASGWSELASRLAADWETSLAPRRRFYESYQRALATDSLPAAAETRIKINDLARQRRWDAAAIELRRPELAECADRLALLRIKVLGGVSTSVTPEAPENGKKDAEVENGKSDDAGKSV
jgi:hypothetical protein